MKPQAGFTLLEFIIAFALLTIILSSVYLMQGSSLASSIRSKNVLLATNLAKSIINESELNFDGIPFDRLPAKESGQFDEPHKQFKWTREVAEVDFGALSELMMKAQEESGSTPKENQGMVAKYFQDYLQKSVRRMTVTISWNEGGGDSSLTFTELLVNYDAEFAAGI
jgi:prepilin-type N-terminal cleavage/methylation domain-containing protein